MKSKKSKDSEEQRGAKSDKSQLRRWRQERCCTGWEAPKKLSVAALEVQARASPERFTMQSLDGPVSNWPWKRVWKQCHWLSEVRVGVTILGSNLRTGLSAFAKAFRRAPQSI